ncbi:MAG: bacteriohemerythrin [Bacillota bacterium]|nr:bacteriohemerythrin [Bacillota bacterium]
MGWTNDLAVGVDLIDEEHKALFEKANELYEAGKNRRAMEFISEMFDFLDEYTKKHFNDEEKFMLEINYPEYDLQKKLHSEFIGKLSELKAEFARSGGNIALIIEANQLVLNWLTKHISFQDKKIGQYVRSLEK